MCDGCPGTTHTQRGESAQHTNQSPTTQASPLQSTAHTMHQNTANRNLEQRTSAALCTKALFLHRCWLLLVIINGRRQTHNQTTHAALSQCVSAECSVLGPHVLCLFTCRQRRRPARRTRRTWPCCSALRKAAPAGSSCRPGGKEGGGGGQMKGIRG